MLMNQETKIALKDFFSAQKKLNQQGIIRSKNYLDDIGRYLCKVMYNMELVKSRQQIGYDGTIGTSKVLVRINNCPIGTKVRLVEPFEFDELIVVLASNSLLRPESIDDDFIFYRFTRDEALNKFKTQRGNYVGGKELFSQKHDKALRL